MNSNINHVRALAALKTPALLLRYIDGFTPFHLAIKLGYSQVASLLAETSPPEVLYMMETVVGATALETAVHCDLISRARVRLDNRCIPGGFSYGDTGIDSTGHFPADSKKLGERAEALKATIDQLKKERRLTRGAKVTEALSTFADNMLTKTTEMKVKEVELEKGTGDEKESDTKALHKMG